MAVTTISPRGTVTTNSVDTLLSLIVPLRTVPAPPRALIPHIIPLRTVPTPLYTPSPRIMPLPTMPAPLIVPLSAMPTPLLISPLAIPCPSSALLLSANSTLSSLRFLAENILPLRTIRRIKTWVCFRI
ncbi:hypothetical protein MBLNU13_g07194t1 [Cladosporium sp. NU13]